MAKPETKKMKFKEDKFVDGELTYSAGRTYEIPVASVERWQKRGGELVIDAKGTDEEIVEDIDAKLAQDLAKDGKIPQEEAADALQPKEDEEDLDVLDDAPKGKGKASKGKKSGK